MQERNNADSAASTPPVLHSLCFMVKTRRERPTKEMMCVEKAPNPFSDFGLSSFCRFPRQRLQVGPNQYETVGPETVGPETVGPETVDSGARDSGQWGQALIY
jgi:hypothetical protein